MTFERFEGWIKKNKWTSIILIALFIVTTAFSITDTGSRLIEITKGYMGHKRSKMFEVTGNGEVEKRLNLAKLESTKYKIPSSSNAVVKFINLPMLNDLDLNSLDYDIDSTSSIVVAVSPIKPISNENVFDGSDCRLGLTASAFDQVQMTARFEVNSISCTDNQGYAYSLEPDHSLGYLSELHNPGIHSVNIVNIEGYLTINPEKNYFVQMYNPIQTIDKLGISFFGRF